VKDSLAVGLGALGSGAGFGGGAIVAALVIVRALERYEDSAANPVLVGTFAGIAVAAGLGWWRSRSLDNIGQRGVIAVMAAVGALLLGFIAWPVHRLLGLAGLAAWGVASLLLGGASSVWARKGSREDAIDETGERGKREEGRVDR
jgi:hypothetical protein